MLLGNGFVAVGMALACGSTAKISAFWFRPEMVSSSQRTTATMIASVANLTGGAIGSLIPAFIVTHSEKSLFVILLLIEAAVSVVLCGLTLIFMRSKPPTPPSPSGSQIRDSFWPALKSIMKNRNFVLIFIVAALSLGSYNTFTTAVQLMIAPYGFSSVSHT